MTQLCEITKYYLCEIQTPIKFGNAGTKTSAQSGHANWSYTVNCASTLTPPGPHMGQRGKVKLGIHASLDQGY